MGSEYRGGSSGRLRTGSVNPDSAQSVIASGGAVAPALDRNLAGLESFHQFQKNFNTFLENLPKATNVSPRKFPAYRTSANLPNLYSSFDGQWCSPADGNTASSAAMYGSPYSLMDTNNVVGSPINGFDVEETSPKHSASVKPSVMSVETRSTQAPTKRRPSSPTSVIETSMAATVYSSTTIPDFDFPVSHPRNLPVDVTPCHSAGNQSTYLRSGSARQNAIPTPTASQRSPQARKDVTSRFLQMGEECQRLLQLCSASMQQGAVVPTGQEEGCDPHNNGNPSLGDPKLGSNVAPSLGVECWSSPKGSIPGMTVQSEMNPCLSSHSIPNLLSSPLNIQVVQYIHNFIEESLKLYRMTQDLYERLKEEQQPELSLMSLVPVESFGTNMPNAAGNYHHIPKGRRPANGNNNMDYSDTYIRQYVNASLAGMLNLEAEESAGNSDGSCHRYMRTTRSLVTTLGGVEHINGYKVLKILGYGATSKVRLCSNVSSRRYVAVKSVIMKAQKPRVFAQPSEVSVACDSGSYACLSSDPKSSPQKSVPAPPPVLPVTELSPAEVEIRILRRLTHPYIIPLEEVIDDEEENMVHLVLGFVSRGPVIKVKSHDDDLNRTPCDTVRPFSKLARYVQEVMEALVHVHNHDFVHNDVKPDNILIDEEDHVKLIDFGVSRRVPHAYRPTGHNATLSTTSASISYNYTISNTNNLVAPDSSLFISNGVDIHGKIIDKLGIGTPAFAAPELIGDNDCSAHSDTWSLGVVMYGMIFGYLPFSTRTIRETIDEVLLKPIEFPPYDKVPNNELNENGERDLSEVDYQEWVRVCTGFLQREPHARWPLPYVLKHRFFQFELAEPLHPKIFAHMNGATRWSAEVFNSGGRTSVKSLNMNTDSHEVSVHVSHSPGQLESTSRSMSASGAAENPLQQFMSERRSLQWEDYPNSGCGNCTNRHSIVDVDVDESCSSFSSRAHPVSSAPMDKLCKASISCRGRSPPAHALLEKAGARSTHEVVIKPPFDVKHRHSYHQVKNRLSTGTYNMVSKEADTPTNFVPKTATGMKNGNANFPVLSAPTPVMVQNFFSGRLSPGNDSKEAPLVVLSNDDKGTSKELSNSGSPTGIRQLSRTGKRNADGVSDTLPRNASVSWQQSSDKNATVCNHRIDQNSNSSTAGCTSSRTTEGGGADLAEGEHDSTRVSSNSDRLGDRTESSKSLNKLLLLSRPQSGVLQKNTEGHRPAFSGTESRQ